MIYLDDNARIDLHLHTTVSDGTDTPEEIARLVKKAGIDLFSVTDHDALKGCKVIAGLPDLDAAFITGVEFSCKDEEGKYHILGYGYDPDAKPINDLISKGHGFRMKKTKERLEFIKDRFGFEFAKQEIKELLELDNPGKPHIANLMIKHGYANDKKEAIRKYIDQKRFKSEYVRPDEAIRAILESGGIPVLAHPFYGNGGDLIIGEEMRERLVRLIGFGIKGVEAYYSGFTDKLISQMLAFAEEYELYVTAGSDYHGHNKIIELGDNNLDRVGDGPAGLKRFLNDVRTIKA